MSPQLQKNGPVGDLNSCFKNGCISEQLFFEWLIHFKHSAEPSKDEPVLMNGTTIKM
jgi:hypothetical protein